MELVLDDTCGPPAASSRYEHVAEPVRKWVLNASPASPEGDEAIFAAVYPGLRRFAAVVGSIEDDPDDLVQDALLRALRGGELARFDSPMAYLRRVVTNLAADRRRSLGRQRRALGRLGNTASVTAIYPSDTSDLDRLKPLDRAVLYLGEIEGRPLAEIGELLGLSHDAVRVRASRARHQLRSELHEEETSP